MNTLKHFLSPVREARDFDAGMRNDATLPSNSLLFALVAIKLVLWLGLAWAVQMVISPLVADYEKHASILPRLPLALLIGVIIVITARRSIYLAALLALIIRRKHATANRSPECL